MNHMEQPSRQSLKCDECRGEGKIRSDEWIWYDKDWDKWADHGQYGKEPQQPSCPEFDTCRKCNGTGQLPELDQQ